MFNEKTHAFIVASFYKHLTEKHGERGKDIFIKATQKYAEQRGARMAMRAMRDGYPLDYASYFAYGGIPQFLPSLKMSVKTVKREITYTNAPGPIPLRRWDFRSAARYTAIR